MYGRRLVWLGVAISAAAWLPTGAAQAQFSELPYGMQTAAYNLTGSPPAAESQGDDGEDGLGLPDILYAQLFAGPSYVHLAAFSNDSLLSIDPDTIDPDSLGIDPANPTTGDVTAAAAGQLLDQQSGWGHTLGAAAGVRLLFLTLGARYAFGDYSAFNLSTLLLEAGIRPKLWFIEPYFRLGFGWAWLDSERIDMVDSRINGFALETGLGLDFRVHELLSFGIGGDADLLNLSRETDLSEAASVNLEEGSAVGGQLRIQGHVTLHI